MTIEELARKWARDKSMDFAGAEDNARWWARAFADVLENQAETAYEEDMELPPPFHEQRGDMLRGCALHLRGLADD